MADERNNDRTAALKAFDESLKTNKHNHDDVWPESKQQSKATRRPANLPDPAMAGSAPEWVQKPVKADK